MQIYMSQNRTKMEDLMYPAVTLPVTNEYGYFEIRLESIGGLGANLCGKMLGELGALYLSLNSLSFSSYGSEKRGSPVKSYIRWSPASTPLRINSPVLRPHVLGIFHEGLIGTYPVLDGISADTKIVLNTPLSCDEAAEKYNISIGTLYCLDALSIAMKSRSRINMVMLGAIARACPFIPMESVESLCKNTVGKKYPALIEANLLGLKMGYEKTSEQKLSHRSKHASDMVLDSPASSALAKETYVWGYKNAPIGGINTRPGSTVSNDLSPSREGYIPLFLQERCINCGLCDSTCPDMVFQFAPGTYKGKNSMVNKGLDYRHCKGCLRCVDVCPTHALVKALEKDYPEKPYSMPDQDLLPAGIQYQKTGANSWITSDSYLDEKRIDGGIV
jgi:pyruvate ferredoxin oxidoreductase gamma subunit